MLQIATPAPVSGTDDTDVFALTRLVLERWYVIVAGVALGLLGATLYLWAATPLYRATMKLLVVPSAVQDRSNGASTDPQIAHAYIPFVLNAEVMATAVKRAKLDSPADSWKLADMGRRLSAVPSRAAPILELALDFPEPDGARRLLEAIGVEVIELNRRMLSQSHTDTRQFLGDQLATATKRLESADAALLQLTRAARLEERRKQADVLLSEGARMHTQLQNARVSEAELSTASSMIAKLLSEQQKLITLRRSLAEEGAAQAVVPAAASDTRVLSEVINPLYEAMEPRLVESRSQLAAATAARQRLVADIAASQTRLRALLLDIAADDQRLQRLRLDAELARQHYKLVAERYESARLSVADASSTLRTFEPVRVGSTPVSPRMMPSVVFGGFAGLLVGAVAALAIAFLRRAAAGANSRLNSRPLV